MNIDILRNDTEQLFQRLRLPGLETNGDAETSLPGALEFFSDDPLAVDDPSKVFGKQATTLFETNILRDEADLSEKRIIIEVEGGIACISASEQRNGAYYIAGELMACPDDENRRRVYIRKLLTNILHEAAEPLRSALAELSKSPVADLAPSAHDYLKA